MLRLTQERERLGMSQAKLARLAEINASSLSRIEGGKELAYPHRGKRIADALGWTGDPMELFEEVGEDEAGFKLRGIGYGSSFGHSLYSKVRPSIDGMPLDVNVVFFKNALSPSGISFNFFLLEEDGDMVHGGSYDLPHFWKEDRIEWKLVELKEDTNA